MINFLWSNFWDLWWAILSLSLLTQPLLLNVFFSKSFPLLLLVSYFPFAQIIFVTHSHVKNSYSDWKTFWNNDIITNKYELINIQYRWNSARDNISSKKLTNWILDWLGFRPWKVMVTLTYETARLAHHCATATSRVVPEMTANGG